MSGAVRAILATLALGAAFAIFLWARQPSARVVDAPDFILPNLAGETVRLRDLRGKVVLLNVWATWCPPCVEEMPTLETLAARMRGKDFVLLAVSQDERPKAVKPWVEERGFTFPVLLDPRGQVGHEYGVTGYPETFVIDRQGRIVNHHAGFRDWADPEIVAALEMLLTTGEWPGEGATASETPAIPVNGG
jgi:DsbE subfamily thiol:disulfide oxidoreductase